MARSADKFYERPGFAELNAEWQAKLRESGFDDLEDDFPVAHARDLKREVYRDRVQARRGEQSGMAEYMRRCGRWLHEKVWPTPRRKFVWELYAEGVPRDAMLERMGCVPGHTGWWVGRIIQEERAEMEDWYAHGGDSEEDLPQSLMEEELEANGHFAHIPTRGEGGGIMGEIDG